MDRRYLVAGNWKMNKKLFDAFHLTSLISRQAEHLSTDVEIVLAPPAIYLHTINSMVKDLEHVRVAAQNCHQKNSGAYTGEISAPMLDAMNLSYVILGHSERRQHFHEDNALLAQKVDAVLDHTGMSVIFCCGEPLDVRERGEEKAYVQAQLEESLWHRSKEDFQRMVIAYEPIWAIGTGKTAAPDQAQSMHAFLRQLLTDRYGADTAQNIRLLYGGSCKPSNAASLFAQTDIDGALVGGASLQADDFIAIVKARIKRT